MVTKSKKTKSDNDIGLDWLTSKPENNAEPMPISGPEPMILKLKIPWGVYSLILKWSQDRQTDTLNLIAQVFEQWFLYMEVRNDLELFLSGHKTDIPRLIEVTAVLEDHH